VYHSVSIKHPGPASCTQRFRLNPGKLVLTIAVIVFVLWLLGVIFFKAAKGFIHLLLIIAVIVALVHFFGGA